GRRPTQMLRGAGAEDKRRRQGVRANEGPPPELPAGGPEEPGDDLPSPSTDYPRPWMLNGRVRNGNRGSHAGIRTGNRSCINEVAAAEVRTLSGHGARGKDRCGEAFGC